MKDQKHSTLAELPHRVRATLAAWKTRWRESRADFRPTPARIRSAVVRVGIPLLIFLLLIAGVRWLRTMAQPGGRAAAEDATPSATLFVACTDPGCRAEYSVQRALDFKDWPLKCDRCGGATMERATLCPTCHRWYAGAPACPHCAAKAAERQEAAQPPPRKRADDAEDPW